MLRVVKGQEGEEDPNQVNEQKKRRGEGEECNYYIDYAHTVAAFPPCTSCVYSRFSRAAGTLSIQEAQQWRATA